MADKLADKGDDRVAGEVDDKMADKKDDMDKGNGPLNT